MLDMDILEYFMRDITRDCVDCKTKLEITIEGKGMVKKLVKVCKKCKFRSETCCSIATPGRSRGHGGYDLHNRVVEFGLKTGGYSVIEVFCTSLNLPIMNQRT